MLQSRRDELNNITAGQAGHAGLWLDKYLAHQLKKGVSVPGGDTTPQQQLVEECAGIKEPDSYHLFYERWQAALAAAGTDTEGAEVQTKEARVRGRLAIGLGDESVIETAVALHHTYGTPYIPGSALKGLAASFARQRLGQAWQKEAKAYQILFGAPETAGFITFFDALYVPGSGHKGQALYPDVMTVHHQDYYQGKSGPADWDNTNPVFFLSATGKYLIALAGPASWLKAAFDILDLALAEVGVGAKTSSGYGRLYFEESGDAAETAGAAEATAGPADQGQRQVVEQFKQQLEAMPDDKVAGEIKAHVDRWQALEIDEPSKQKIARALVAKIRQARREKKSRKKKWYQALLASLPEEDA